MSQLPPLLPTEVLRRVLRLARFHAASVLAVTGFFALGSAAAGDIKQALISLAIGMAGAIEWHGAGLIAGGHDRGVRWLIGGQLYLLGTILIYLLWASTGNRVDSFLHLFEQILKTPEGQAQLELQQRSVEEMMQAARGLYYFSMMFAAVVTCAVQGSIAASYYRRRHAVSLALKELYGDD